MGDMVMRVDIMNRKRVKLSELDTMTFKLVDKPDVYMVIDLKNSEKRFQEISKSGLISVVNINTCRACVFEGNLEVEQVHMVGKEVFGNE
jgi:hypothetical protein